MIKYRVYDTKQNKYLHPDTVSISGSGIMSFAGTGGKYHTITQPSDDPSPRFIIEQYTGLKDANGKDIYEGDIVTYYPRHEGVPYKVYWARESAKFLIGRTGVLGQELSSVMHNLDTGRIALEVIGNIHENTELLEKCKSGEYIATDPYNDDRLCKFLKTTSRIKEKDIEMEKTVTNSLIPEGVIPISTGLDLASKLDSVVIDKLSMYGDKNSTPEIGKLCGMRLLLDLSGAPEDAKYELYFEARTLLERIIDRMEKQAAVEVSRRSKKWKKLNSTEKR